MSWSERSSGTFWLDLCPSTLLLWYPQEYPWYCQFTTHIRLKIYSPERHKLECTDRDFCPLPCHCSPSWLWCPRWWLHFRLRRSGNLLGIKHLLGILAAFRCRHWPWMKWSPWWDKWKIWGFLCSWNTWGPPTSIFLLLCLAPYQALFSQELPPGCLMPWFWNYDTE